jgi:hypothetical protein
MRRTFHLETNRSDILLLLVDVEEDVDGDGSPGHSKAATIQELAVATHLVRGGRKGRLAEGSVLLSNGVSVSFSSLCSVG